MSKNEHCISRKGGFKINLEPVSILVEKMLGTLIILMKKILGVLVSHQQSILQQTFYLVSSDLAVQNSLTVYPLCIFKLAGYNFHVKTQTKENQGMRTC